MTAKFLVAVSLGLLALAGCQQQEWPQVRSAADRGANAHYFYRSGWHRVDEALPVGDRAGAQSHPYNAEADAHFEIPDNSPGSDYQNDGSLYDYWRMHNDKVLIKSQSQVYNGNGYLAAGTWTGAPLQSAAAEQAPVTWKSSAQGQIRADEISGQAYMMQASSAPAPANPAAGAPK